MGHGPAVLLASQSPYRRELLGRLLDTFECFTPDADESPLPAEPPEQLAQRLARLKAGAGAANAPGAVVIGSDQVAALGTQLLGKPGSVDRAVSQLLQCSGQVVAFHTAVCVLGPGSGDQLEHLDTTRVRFRNLSEADARRYVEADQPLDCAGSFKAERRGVILLESIDSRDPTAIQGLPLIWLADALRQRGVQII
ncbi:MAG: Maf family protein [Gammaproteobacteria bacterium]